MIRPDGVVKLLDFGLATAPTHEPHAQATTSATAPTASVDPSHEGKLLGTAPYMSPEQARSERVDRRTDVWAFGCVLYEMLTGRRAFDGPTTSDILTGVLEREPDFNALPRDTPSTIRRLLRRMLTKDARNRLRDIGDARLELVEAFAAATNDPTASARDASGALAASASPGVATRRARAVTAGRRPRRPGHRCPGRRRHALLLARRAMDRLRR
jgi:serine/threonine protein kinase